MNSENPKSRPEIDMEGLRSRIKSALSAQRMTVQNLSDAAGIPKSTLDGFLNRGTTPAFDTVATVCAVLSHPCGFHHGRIRRRPVRSGGNG